MLLASCLCNKNNKKQKAQRADKDEGEDQGRAGQGRAGQGRVLVPGGLQHRPVIENTIHVVLSGKDFRRQEGTGTGRQVVRWEGRRGRLGVDCTGFFGRH